MKDKQQPTKVTKPLSMEKGTKMGEIEKNLNIKLGVRSDMKLETFLIKKGFPSLAAMLEK